MDLKLQNWFKVELLLTRSCHVLRKMFKDRWSLFTGQQWLDTPANGHAYTTGIGQKIYQNCRNIQKIMLQTGDTNQWDLTTLLNVLRETKSKRQLNKVDKQRIAKENNDLLTITYIRNNNAHHASKCISDTEFETIWSQLSSILISFGDDADEIAELKLNTSDAKQKEPINTVNTIEAKRLKDLGNEAYKQKHFGEAIKWFSQALVLAGLSDYDRSILYSNRAAAYLEKHETSEVTSSMDSRYLALQDAEHARDLRQTWPKAHFRIGQAHVALGEYEKAVHSFDKALALDPTNSEMRNFRDSALERKHYYDRKDHLNRQNMPRTTREQLNDLSKTSGYTIQQCEKVIDFIRKDDPGKDAVFTGHQYRDGDDNVKQNYELAVRFYSKAAALGNAEGMYNLALLHQQGLGVKKDIQATIELLEQAAAQSPTMSDKLPIPNVGVAEAEHSLGLHYETGVGVEMNYYKAAQWYQRASDHGSATAANNLGLMYGAGKGVAKDLVKSEQLLRLAVTRGDQNAAMNLAILFSEKQDFQAAEQWCRFASENNNILDRSRLKHIRDAAEKQRELFKKLDVENWEKQDGLADFNAALELVPDNIELLYDRAAMLRLTKHVDLNVAVVAHEIFLKYAPVDHRKLPEAYYAAASCYFMNTALKNHVELAEKYYRKGIEAEKQQLPCFLPCESNNKLFLSKFLLLKSAMSDAGPGESSINAGKPKSRLSDPRRLDMIQWHRKSIAEKRKISSGCKLITSTAKPRLGQNSPASLIGLKGITLREMNPAKDYVYQGYVLSGIIFEQSPVVEPSIWLLFEDDNGDLERLFIYNIPASEGWQLIKDTYTYGTKISILNPYMRMAADNKPAIRVDDASSIILHGNAHSVKDMCRCCSEANASRVCSKCRSAHYCSKECQTIDWKQCDHKLICT
ncbi:unnamed protein product [Rotaria sordida]|uniref:MYND-type domain-containing protein n=1 Tax=Rotaria sordida TaxID=392033 RepID=A0A819UCZ1_9BILA|nr:unnamed protein product [Rotaria sordida]CAF4093402.1 unnamed protein product [Rotaria sordida]